jgi:hypothetical protein
MQVTNVLERAHLRSNTGHSWRGGSLQEGCPEQGTRGEGIPYWPYALKIRKWISRAVRRPIPDFFRGDFLELSPGTCFPGGAALALALAESLGVTPERPAALLAVAGDHAEAASPAAARGAAGPTAKALAVGRFVGAAAGWILLGLSQAHAAAAKR